MLIECKYYDVAAKEMEELDKQIAEESENLSEGELKMENDRRDFQLAEIIRSFKEKEKMKETFFSVFFLYLFAVLAIYPTSFLHSVRCSA